MTTYVEGVDYIAKGEWQTPCGLLKMYLCLLNGTTIGVNVTKGQTLEDVLAESRRKFEEGRRDMEARRLKVA